MLIPANPRQLAQDLLPRSLCNVQMTAVISDKHGIFSWGWNSSGNGDGLHAEAHAISRANRRRLKGATITIAGVRKGRGKVISAPCMVCLAIISACGIKSIEFHDKDGMWHKFSR